METTSTEYTIKEAARKVFLSLGYTGATMRLIAAEAGVNVALVNYYFRTKDQLFLSIYKETIQAFMSSLAVLFHEEMPLEVKIYKVVERYTDFVMANPQVPAFIVSYHNTDHGGVSLFQQMGMHKLYARLEAELDAEADAGRIRMVKPLYLISVIMGSVVFPVLAKPIVKTMGQMDDVDFATFMEDRKTMVPAMIMSYLRSG